jgi:hypothetical protein
MEGCDDMKILKVKSREYGGKSYYKYRINVPEEILEIAGLQDGDDLVVEVKKGELRLKKKIKKRGQ